jgi:predicted NAD/FAD-binding protein
MLNFPAENFVAFFRNHRLLHYHRPVWRTVKGGSRNYVEKLTTAFRQRFRLGCAVTSIERTPHGVVIRDSRGGIDSYDHVVIGAHSDQALAMLSDADDQERKVLGAIGYTPNTIFLHRDVRLMPKRRKIWASWNFLRWQREARTENDVAVTYWMNELQGIDKGMPLFVSLNPPFEPDPMLTFRNLTPRPLPHRSNSTKFRDGVAPGSAAPGQDTASTRTGCDLRWPSRKRWEQQRHGANRRDNLPRQRSSDVATDCRRAQ